MTNQPAIRREGEHLIMPGFASAHSHAFQRALRARTQREAGGSFWSWRELMYGLAKRLDPDDIFQISRFAFAELAMSGVTAVGEFHYLHHSSGGSPYADRLAMAEAAVQAAREAGLRITLIRSAYFRSGYRKPLESSQRRFCDASAEEVFRDLEALKSRFSNERTVGIALAAHSIRAVPSEALVELAEHARRKSLPFHMHLSEQQREVDECLEEYGLRPVELLSERGILDSRFVAVHATHLSPKEIEALGRSFSFVCLCRTTERDLGDGLPHASALLKSGVRFCVGVDSHAGSDAFEEIRAVELDERSRLRARHSVAGGEALLKMATMQGYEAIGMKEAWEEDFVYLKSKDASLFAVPDDLLADAVIFGATPRAVDRVIVAGRPIVEDGMHIRYEEALRGFEATLRKLDLL